MKGMSSKMAVILLLFVQASFAQAPSQAAKEFSHTLSIEGAGKLTLSYRSLHWNDFAYNAAKKNAQQRERLNNGLWKKIGKFDTDFDVVIAGVAVPKGSYSLGINFDDSDHFKVVLGGTTKDIYVPLTTEADDPLISYLTFDIRPSSTADTFTLEGRSGKFRSYADLKIPSLSTPAR
ncbi:MAG TPA: hypothetical protein VJX67_05680 [Blastocatellia bacterium]|nr:hypothetical protein [Blastocatellia bacterium]